MTTEAEKNAAHKQAMQALKAELMAIADLVKHPFEQGIKAQRGIDF